MSGDQTKPSMAELAAAAKPPPKQAAFSVASECVPVELLRKYSSPKPVRLPQPIVKKQ